MFTYGTTRKKHREEYTALLDAIIILGNRECEVLMQNPAMSDRELSIAYSWICRARWRVEERLEGLTVLPIKPFIG
jgi:hypothetical protein